MTIVVDTFGHLDVELRIAARDMQARIAKEESDVAQATAQSLGTLERTITTAENDVARLERIIRLKDIFIEKMSELDWPHFHDKQAIVGKRQEPVWKGFLGYREANIIERRSVRSWCRKGITTRGEFIVCQSWGNLSQRVIACDDPEFDLRGFEDCLELVFDHYGFDSNV